MARKNTVSDNWLGGITRGGMIFRGILLALVGGLLLAEPVMQSVVVMTVAVGVIVLIKAMAMLLSFGQMHKSYRWVMFFYALFLFIIGIITIAQPLLMSMMWVYVIAFWQLMDGFNCFYLAAADLVPNRALAILSGILSLGVGILFLVWPLAGAITLIWVLGAVLLAYGVIIFFYGLILPKKS